MVRGGPSRDFVGYGRDIPRVQWPGGARVALNIVVNYEEGSERSFAAGDGVNEGLGEVARAVGPGYRDLATESVYEYGSRAGIHRLMRLFAELGVRCTFFAAAQALEINPGVAGWIREFDHEVCSHGWRWSEDWTVGIDEQRDRIRKAVTSIEKSCGKRPVGWYSRWMASEFTRQLLVEEGGFLYDSDSYNDDLPYHVDVESRRHLVIPYTLTYNDLRFTSTGLSPDGFVDYCTRALEYLWEEGAERPRMMSVGLHPRWTGQAGRSSALRDFLRRAIEMEGVWISTREEIAHVWNEQFGGSD